MIPWNAARTKVQIKLSIQRLRTLQDKKHALAKKARRDIADLVGKGRTETAKLRVEGLIQDDIYVELLELLELYAETLQARFGLLDTPSGETPEPSIADAVCAIVYAAPRTELKELQVLREILMHKYGRNFALALQPSDPPPASVPPRILSKLAVYRPPADLVEAYLSEIARGYGVSYVPALKAGEVEGVEPLEAGKSGEESGEAGSGGSDDGNESGGSGGTKEPAVAVENPQDTEKKDEKKSASPAPAYTPAPPPQPRQTIVAKKPTEDDELAARFERLKNLR